MLNSKPLSLLQQPVKTHSQLMRFSWVRLWYYFRAVDIRGSGLMIVPWNQTLSILGCGYSTLYQWLREAKKAGAIYEYQRKGNSLKVRLGGLFNVCRTLGIKRWGAAAVLPLESVLKSCREIATAITVQQLQEQSRYAARKSLLKGEEKVFTMPNASDVIQKGKNASLKPDRGATNIPFLLHVGAKRAFVSKGFVPFGVSQMAVATELTISDRTVRRHLNGLGVERRQLVQAKHAYRFIKAGIQLNLNDCLVEPNISYRLEDREIILHEPNGASGSKRKGGHKIPLTGNALSLECDRFFNYYGQTWIYRCNLYGLSYEFNSMKFARRKYKKSLLKHKRSLSQNRRDGEIIAYKS